MILVALLLTASENNRSSLLQASTPLRTGRSLRLVGAYTWKSETEVFWLQTQGRGIQPTSVDVSTSVLKSYSSLLSRLRENRIDELSSIDWRLSVKGDWILVSAVDDDRFAYGVFPLDGTEPLTLNEVARGSRFIFLRDNRGWIELVGLGNQCRARIYRFNGSIRREDIAIERSVGRPVGFNSAGAMICAEGGQSAGFTLYAVDLSSKPVDVKQFKPSLPKACPVLEVAMSPDGDRLCWVLESPSLLPRTVIKKHLPFLSFQRKYSKALYISKWDGTELRELGRTAAQDPFYCVRFVPGTNCISFINGETLRTVTY